MAREYACSACCDTGADEGRYCPRECAAFERLAAEHEAEHGWMRSYAKAYVEARRRGDDETAEAIDRMMRT